jgi:hypothetical protein
MREAHTYNPSYSGGRDQEDGGSKSGQENSSVRPYLEKPFTNKGISKIILIANMFFKKIFFYSNIS